MQDSLNSRTEANRMRCESPSVGTYCLQDFCHDLIHEVVLEAARLHSVCNRAATSTAPCFVMSGSMRSQLAHHYSHATVTAYSGACHAAMNADNLSNR